MHYLEMGKTRITFSPSEASEEHEYNCDPVSVHSHIENSPHETEDGRFGQEHFQTIIQVFRYSEH